MGRPTKLTADVQARIVEAINAGNYQETAAAYAGIAPAAFYAWMSRGRAERDRITNGHKPDKTEARYLEFTEAVERARSVAEMRHVLNITKAAETDGTWQASAWWLERSFPKRWGRQARVEVTGTDGGPIQVEDGRDALLRLLGDSGPASPDGA